MLLGLGMKTGDQAYITKAQQELSAAITNLKSRPPDDLTCLRLFVDVSDTDWDDGDFDLLVATVKRI